MGYPMGMPVVQQPLPQRELKKSILPTTILTMHSWRPDGLRPLGDAVTAAGAPK
jgi:hypothetical protein